MSPPLEGPGHLGGAVCRLWRFERSRGGPRHDERLAGRPALVGPRALVPIQAITVREFDADGKILDIAYEKRIDKFLGELIWMSKVLRYGRESISI